MSDSQQPTGSTDGSDENRLIAQRRDKLNAIKAQRNAFPNSFRRSDYAADIHSSYADKDKEALGRAGEWKPVWPGVSSGCVGHLL